MIREYMYYATRDLALWALDEYRNDTKKEIYLRLGKVTNRINDVAYKAYRKQLENKNIRLKARLVALIRDSNRGGRQ